MEEKYTGIDLGLEKGYIISIPKEKIKECEIHMDFKNNLLFNAKIRFVMSPEFSTFFRNYYHVTDSSEDEYERDRFIDYLMQSDRLNIVDITIKHKEMIISSLCHILILKICAKVIAILIICLSG